ncbi:uncharacterized protein LOC123720090 isoform X2 [Pieris brassicae]|uniref:uncharacterized protein LOC123720090 isoform X2 n=1 Tax=Pieris brassicae TaxID=7116 RepID=UPI001E65E39B|nr:uncharacterized protein LOC123720090 isoform X2 [Pieris brassicae]
MASSDSMFLFEFIVEKFRSGLDSETIYFKANFKDVFDISLDIQREIKTKVKRKKTKIRTIKSEEESQQKVSLTKIKTGGSILISMIPQQLINSMFNNELEVSLWNKNLNKKLGSLMIPWTQSYLNYISALEYDQNKLPVSVRKVYTICNNFKKKIALVKLKVRLSYFEAQRNNELIPKSLAYYVTKSSQLNSDINKIEQTLDKQHGVIKTTYSGNKVVKSIKTNKDYKSKLKPIFNSQSTKYSENKEKVIEENIISEEQAKDYAKSEKIRNTKVLSKSKSLTNIEKNRYKPVHYIFGDPKGQFGGKTYCVNYFTVERDLSNQTSKSSITDKSPSNKSIPSKAKFKFKPCDSECQVMKNRSGSCPASTCTLDLPEEAAPLISIAKCKQVVCDNKQHRVLPPPADDQILLDLSSLQRDCCDRTDMTEMVQEVVGGMTAKMKVGKDPCYCSCECRFGFMKKTTYCGVCGGYEMIGEELAGKQIKEVFPCPFYHKLIDKNKLKTLSISGSDSKKKGDDVSVKAMKVSSSQKATASEKRTPTQTSAVTEKKSVESEKDSKKSKKKKKDDRFKFNYGYKAPQIGHSRCAFPCTGTLNNVPKKMGWLWTAEDVPGMKFRPGWKPGATNKHVVRLLRMARNPGEVLLPKKKRREASKKKPLLRPLLIVHKKEGEFTVTMETMKTYAKPRAVNQCPYEDKPVLTYTIGRTEEENQERKKKKAREQRRLERSQRQFIQSAFKDMCREICLKTYQQALGILPDAEDPECTCYPALPSADRTNLDISCSCSQDESSIGSDTDSDEWIVEFTPPCATFKPTSKAKKVTKSDNSTQYTYLDYRVKLLDRLGNPVPRYFKGPDGKQQCSDLGGFWGPDKKWLTINIDGYVAPDGRWAPNYFIGPNGENVEGAAGKFQSANNNWLVVGVDGFVDCQGRWRFYPKPRGMLPDKKLQDSKKKGTRPGATDKKNKEDMAALKSEASWSCFGGASATELSKLGIVGHGHDKKLLLTALKELLAQGENVKIPQPSTVYRLPPSKKRRRMPTKQSRSPYEERSKCTHSLPSGKGIVAVDDQGNKTYFRLKGGKNVRPKQRLKELTRRGISLSSFHVPCLRSFIGTELMKKQQRARLIALSTKNAGTQK